MKNSLNTKVHKITRRSVLIPLLIAGLFPSNVVFAQGEIMRELLIQLQELLEQANEPHLVELVKNALSGSDAELEQFLVSNELWGGSGSIADQAGIDSNGDQESRRDIESKLIEIGRQQISMGVVNRRTSMWVTAFESWRESGIR